MVLADAVAADQSTTPVFDIVSNALPGGDDGTIITFHDGGLDPARTIDAVDRLLTELSARDFRFVTVSEYAGLTPGAAIGKPSTSQRIGAFAVVSVMAASRWIATLLLVGALLLLILEVVRAVLLITLARRSMWSSQQRRILAATAQLPSVTVLVPAHNEEDGIEEVVRCLAASLYPTFDVIVINDGSTDATAELVRGLGLDNVSVINQSNRGAAHALNAGIVEATGDVVVFVEGSTLVEPGTLRALVSPLLNPAVGAVGGMVRVRYPEKWLGRWQHIDSVLANAERPMFDEVGSVLSIPAAIGAYRRDVVRAIGGIPTGTAAEEIDLTLAVQRAGWQVALAPDARAWSEPLSSYRALWRQCSREAQGTVQAIGHHRSAVHNIGPGRRLGRFVLPYAAVFSVMAAVLAPVVDVFALVALAQGRYGWLLAVWGGFNAAMLLVAAFAFHSGGEQLRSLWAVPFQQFASRQMKAAAMLGALHQTIGGRGRRRFLGRPTLVTQSKPLPPLSDLPLPGERMSNVERQTV